MNIEDLPKPLKPLNISVSVQSEDIFEITVNVANHYKIQLELLFTNKTIVLFH